MTITRPSVLAARLFLGALGAHLLVPLTVIRATAADAVPFTIPVIKLEYPGNPPNVRMVYVNILRLGGRKINTPLLLDTGSSGMTIECASVIPKKLCSSKGIKIKRDLELDGIRVTTEQAVMSYGTYDEYGNIAYASVTFGKAGSSATTEAEIPFLLRYKKVRRSDGEIVGGPLWPKGIFGISPIGGGGPEQMLRSPIAAVDVKTGLRRGYYLTPIGDKWKKCTNEGGNCPAVKALHIGISDAVKSEFNVQKLQTSNEYYNFPTLRSCFSLKNSTICRPTVYDTGNSTILIAADQPPDFDGKRDLGTQVTVGIDKLAEWTFQTGYDGELEFSRKAGHGIVGIRYFERNSLLVDLESEEIGVRIGN